MILNQLGSGSLASQEGAGLLGISERQLRRLRRAYEERGAAALAHGNRGRSPVNVVTASVRQQVVMLATTRYHGFNHQHLTEMLVEREQIELSRPTVHRILKEAGVVSPRKRRPAKARRRRDRFPREGMLLQVDGSWHDWLEGRGPYLSLVGALGHLFGPPRHLLQDQEPRAQPRGADRWPAAADPVCPLTRRARDPAHPGSLAPGQGPRGAALGNVPRPARHGSALSPIDGIGQNC